MKKLLILAAVTLTVVSFSSCKKDYNCTCKGTSMSTIVVPLNGYSKNDAEETCTTAETTYKVGDPSCTCTLD